MQFSQVKFRIVTLFLCFQVLASILHKAAREGAYVQATKVQDILGVTVEETTVPETMPAGNSGHVTPEIPGLFI